MTDRPQGGVGPRSAAAGVPPTGPAADAGGAWTSDAEPVGVRNDAGDVGPREDAAGDRAYGNGTAGRRPRFAVSIAVVIVVALAAVAVAWGAGGSFGREASPTDAANVPLPGALDPAGGLEGSSTAASPGASACATPEPAAPAGVCEASSAAVVPAVGAPAVTGTGAGPATTEGPGGSGSPTPTVAASGPGVVDTAAPSASADPAASSAARSAPPGPVASPGPASPPADPASPAPSAEVTTSSEAAPTSAAGFKVRGTVVPIAFPLPASAAYRYGAGWRVPRVGVARAYNQIRGVASDGSYLRAHDGFDLLVKTGTPVLAPFAGKVVDPAKHWKPWDPARYGKVVVIESTEPTSPGYRVILAHLSSTAVKVGDDVVRGQVVGRTGKTGNAAATPSHLHLELRAPFLIKYGYAHVIRRLDVFDPEPSLRAADPKGR